MTILQKVTKFPYGPLLVVTLISIRVTVCGCCLINQGWFSKSELYYGAYTNEKIGDEDNPQYNMPLAYLLVGGGYLLLCLIMLVYRYSMWYMKT